MNGNFHGLLLLTLTWGSQRVNESEAVWTGYYFYYYRILPLGHVVLHTVNNINSFQYQRSALYIFLPRVRINILYVLYALFMNIPYDCLGLGRFFTVEVIYIWTNKINSVAARLR